jgi:membrane protein CcdC involved in cytochrome C biogenesis
LWFFCCHASSWFINYNHANVIIAIRIKADKYHTSKKHIRIHLPVLKTTNATI